MNSKRRREHGAQDVSPDYPVYSRLFVAYDKKLTENDIRNAFEEFGKIENIKIPYDNEGNSKGICFIKFYKTSDAARALEALHLKYIPGSNRVLKISVANNPSDVESNEHDEEKYKRLFIQFPQNLTEANLEEVFSTYGHVSSIHILRDKDTGQVTKFAYITYYKFSEAANAFENCDRQYKAIFAKPRVHKTEPNSNLFPQTDNRTALISMMGPCSRGFTRVHYKCSPYLNKFQVQQLFDLIPGMVNFSFYLNYNENCGSGMVSFSNATSAAYAVEKLTEFEYPPGMPIYVKPDHSSVVPEENLSGYNIPKVVSNLKDAVLSATNSGTPDLAQLAMAITEAQKVVKAATGTLHHSAPDSSDPNYCSVKLPPPQPLADIDSQLAKRCFLICKPSPPPLTVLRDIFSRFGDLINVYTLPNKIVGYARYASESAADQAIKTLHGAEICGVRIKVLEAEAEDASRKRRKDS